MTGLEAAEMRFLRSVKGYTRLDKIRSEVTRKELEISGIQAVSINTNLIGSTILKEWTTPDCRNTPSTTNFEEEEIVDATGKYDNASMAEQVKRPNPWRKIIIMIMIIFFSIIYLFYSCYFLSVLELPVTPRTVTPAH
jgi:hypothetical protein